MTAPDHIVYVIDDDPRVGEAVTELLSSAGSTPSRSAASPNT